MDVTSEPEGSWGMANKEGPHDAFPVRTVARMTGLSADLIRAWERRYGVVTPVRGPRGARLYTNDDIAHLRLLAQAVASGRAIGDVARLGARELQVLVGSAAPALVPTPARPAPRATGEPAPAAPVVAALLASIQRLDAAAVEDQLSDSLIVLGHRDFARQIVAPLLVVIGERWGAGSLTVGAEHLASGLLRNLLGGLIRAHGSTVGATVLLATPSGERHELGLLLVSLLLRDAGIGVHYLGPDVPTADILASAHRANVSVVGVGFADSGNRTRAGEELRRLELHLDPRTELWLGGREAAAVATATGSTRGIVVDSLDQLDHHIARLRDQAMLHR